jgi:hypothetical protein
VGVRDVSRGLQGVGWVKQFSGAAAAAAAADFLSVRSTELYELLSHNLFWFIASSGAGPHAARLEQGVLRVMRIYWFFLLFNQVSHLVSGHSYQV